MDRSPFSSPTKQTEDKPQLQSKTQHQQWNDMQKEEEDEEDFSKEFHCCICLDLLYKPVVLACGHLSCFWCVFNAMNILFESHCPLCRHSYNHFPSVCQLLHFLLFKMYPKAYKRRELQVGEEEQKLGHYSPQFDHPNNNSDVYSNYLASIHPQTEEKESSSLGALQEATVSKENAEGLLSAPSATGTCSSIEKAFECGAQKQISVTDLLCPECNKLLFQPVVLNCGHVYCKSCITIPSEGIPRCKICQSLHTNAFPSVCFVLKHFLEEHFHELYAKRREESSKQANCSTSVQPPAERTSAVPKGVYSSWWFRNGPKVHIGVGCDYCGISPIIGERYKCKDCMEKIGFDLCETCYNNPSKIAGRFNQQHKPDHKFEVVQPQTIADLLAMLNMEQLSDDDAANNASEVQGDTSLAETMSDDSPHDEQVASNFISYDDVPPDQVEDSHMHSSPDLRRL